MRIRTSASQKNGTAVPSTTKAVPTRSSQEPGRTPETMPTGTPMTTPTPIAAKVRTKVGPALDQISEATSWLVT